MARRKTKTAEEAVTEAVANGEEVVTTTNADGEEVVQRPIDINLEAEDKPKRVAGKRVNVISLYPSRLFLSGGEYIDYHEEKAILKSDAEKLGDRVREL